MRNTEEKKGRKGKRNNRLYNVEGGRVRADEIKETIRREEKEEIMGFPHKSATQRTRSLQCEGQHLWSRSL